MHCQNSNNIKEDPNKPMFLDKETAGRHIGLLHGDANALVTFFVVKDFVRDGEDKDPHHRHGTLGQHWEYLASKNQAGYGIFILVQQGNGKGRTKHDIIGLNALFTDDDQAVLLQRFDRVAFGRGRRLVGRW